MKLTIGLSDAETPAAIPRGASDDKTALPDTTAEELAAVSAPAMRKVLLSAISCAAVAFVAFNAEATAAAKTDESDAAPAGATVPLSKDLMDELAWKDEDKTIDDADDSAAILSGAAARYSRAAAATASAPAAQVLAGTLSLVTTGRAIVPFNASDTEPPPGEIMGVMA